MPYLILLFLLLSGLLQGQHQLRGVVCQAIDNRPLPFTTITADGITYVTDIDGGFSIDVLNPVVYFTRKGYRPDTLVLDQGRAFYRICLQKYSLPASVHGKELIKQAIARKGENNPLQHLASFRFESYNKLLVTAHPDSIAGAIERKPIKTIFGEKIKVDSSQFKIKKHLQKQHFFATEKSAIYEFDGKHVKETIKGTRMSGFREPLYEIIGLSFQSFTLYGNTVELLGNSYQSPLSARGIRLYDYQLLDTVQVDGRSTYLVYFKDRRKKAAGLEGALYLDADNLAVARSELRVAGLLKITAKVQWEWQDKGFWFPASRSFSIRKGTGPYAIKLLGETIRFDAHQQGANLVSDQTELMSESVYGGYEFNIPLKIRHKFLAIEVGSNAIDQPDAYWSGVRPTLPDQREIITYQANDSIVARQKIEKRLKLGRKIINGYVPCGPIDLDIRQVISYNNFEGFRLGAGGVTNDRFSDIFRFDGYYAVGTKDLRRKYGLGQAVRIGKFSNTWLGIAYTDDIKEIASTTFATDKRIFKLYDPRPFNITTFYRAEAVRGYIETKILPKTESIWQISQAYITPLFDYNFFDGTNLYNRFTLSTAMVSLQWSPFSDFMQTPAGRFETEKRSPKLTCQYTQSFEGLLGSNFTYSQVDFRAEYDRIFLDGQKTSFLLQGGYTAGAAPLTHLFSTSPNHLNRDAVLQRITFAGKNSFETMYFNEFFSSKFISVQLKHQLKPIELGYKIKPVPVMVTRMVWGAMDRPEQHIGVNYKTLNKGFFESGVELNRIYKGFGFSGFYRFGAYHLPRFENNLSLKISFVLDLGI